MERENMYILLELPFDPPATDPAQIKAAIHAKHQQWTQQLDDPQLRSVSQKYLELLPEIEDIMLHEDKREAEAEKALALSREAYDRFLAELAVLEAKEYLLPKELTGLAKKYFPYGITRGDIHKELTVPVTDTAPKSGRVSTLRALAQDKMRSIRGNLEILGKKDLYDFLGVSSKQPREEILAAAKKTQQTYATTPDRSAETFAAQILAESSLSTFDADETKEQYDLALTVSDYPELNDLLDAEYLRAQFVSSEALVRMVNFGVTTYKAKVLEIEEYIRRYCQAYGISVDFMHHHVQCPNCQEMNPGGATHCVHCAAPLEGNCPSCSAPFSEGEAVCTNCGFLIGKMGKALEQLDTAENMIIEGNWSAAARALEHAESFWPGNPRTEQLEEKNKALENKNIDYIQTLDDYISEHRFYAAQTLIEETEAQQIRIPETTKKLVEQTIQDFEVKIQALREKDGATYDTLQTMLSYVSDSIDLERMMIQYPPEPPTRIIVRKKEDTVQIDWNSSPSSGVIRYILVRKEDSVPITAYDGDVLYEGTHHSFTDQNIPPLRSYYYSVFVKRGQSYSSFGAVSPTAIQIVPELSGLRILPADGGAQITWDAIPELQKVNIWRKLGGDAPTAPGEGMELDCDRLDGFADMKLRNDVEYWYYLTATYATGDTLVTSAGISEKVTPRRLSAPIDQFAIVPEDEGENAYFAQWEHTEEQEQDVMLLLSLTKPSYYVGEVVRVTDLLFSHHRLALQNQTEHSARFVFDFSGGVYIFPVTVQGKIAVVGTSVYLTNVSEVTKPTATTVGEDLYITFDWPSGPIGEVSVAWKYGDYPETLEETGITAVTCSKRQYQTDHGVKLSGLGTGNYYFTIFAAFETEEGKIIHSTGTQLLVDNTPHQEIRYKVKHSKGLFSATYTTTITVWSEEEFTIPKAVLVGKEGSLPLRITDGTPYFELERDRPVTGSITFEYKTEKLPDDLYLRFFYYDNSMYNIYRPLPEKTMLLTK